MNVDLAIVGGGPAGLAAALKAKENGVEDILILERDKKLGGILQQCIHNGFGIHIFSEELTGPEYAHKFIKKIKEKNINYKLNSMVCSINNKKEIIYVNENEGLITVKAKFIILAMGCRERARGSLGIAGTRPSGIFTAGTAQRFVNIEGKMIGKKVVILGSGDIGLIMARRMTLEGAKVLAVLELMEYSGGLNRNIVQCLDDYNIPLFLNHTITKIIGKKRLKAVIVSKVDENRKLIKGTEKQYDCDTLLLSVGLIPETDLVVNAGVELNFITNGIKVYENMETNVSGIFACGNVVHVHDLVDFVTLEAEKAGKYVSKYIQNKNEKFGKKILVLSGNGIRYIVPNSIRLENVENEVLFMFRTTKKYAKVKIYVLADGNCIKEFTKIHLSPGKMEKIKLEKKYLNSDIKNISIKIKEI